MTHAVAQMEIDEPLVAGAAPAASPAAPLTEDQKEELAAQIALDAHEMSTRLLAEAEVLRRKNYVEDSDMTCPASAQACTEDHIDPQRHATVELAVRFSCSICLNGVVRPVSCSQPCANLTCRACFLRIPIVGGVRPCPTCAAPTLPSTMMDQSHMLASSIVRCRFRLCGARYVLGIDMRGEWKHLTTCVHVKTACIECNQQVSHARMDRHRTTQCEMRTVVCPTCDVAVRVSTLEAHSAGTDGDCVGMIACPNKCGTATITGFRPTKVRIADLASHMNLTCTQAATACPSCAEMVQRNQLDEHYRASIAAHIRCDQQRSFAQLAAENGIPQVSSDGEFVTRQVVLASALAAEIRKSSSFGSMTLLGNNTLRLEFLVTNAKGSLRDAGLKLRVTLSNPSADASAAASADTSRLNEYRYTIKLSVPPRSGNEDVAFGFDLARTPLDTFKVDFHPAYTNTTCVFTALSMMTYHIGAENVINGNHQYGLLVDVHRTRIATTAVMQARTAALAVRRASRPTAAAVAFVDTEVDFAGGAAADAPRAAPSHARARRAPASIEQRNRQQLAVSLSSRPPNIGSLASPIRASSASASAPASIMSRPVFMSRFQRVTGAAHAAVAVDVDDDDDHDVEVVEPYRHVRRRANAPIVVSSEEEEEDDANDDSGSGSGSDRRSDFEDEEDEKSNIPRPSQNHAVFSGYDTM